MIPAAVGEWLLANGFGAIRSAQPASSREDYESFDLQTELGLFYSLKIDHDSPAERFISEAQSLEALAVPGGPRLPKPIHAGADFLLLEHLGSAPAKGDFWAKLGQQVAGLHHKVAGEFGFSFPTYLGRIAQPNDWSEDCAAFFGGQRLLWQARRASGEGLLSRNDIKRIEQLAGRLRRLVPQEQPALLHGNLWIKTVVADSNGEPALIDPAPYYGWAEADLASTALFGVFPEDFFRAYEALRPLEPDYRQRFPIYNLYPLLVRLNLYGEAFLSPILAVLDKYV